MWKNIQKQHQKLTQIKDGTHKKVALFRQRVAIPMKLATKRWKLTQICIALKYENDKDIIETHFVCLLFLGFSNPLSLS